MRNTAEYKYHRRHSQAAFFQMNVSLNDERQKERKTAPPACNLKKMSRHLMGDITGPPGSRPELKHTRTEAEDTAAGQSVVV